jgi:hypothetical protein
MKTKEEIIQIVDAHSQKYLDSCAPSLVEMLLKLSGSVPSDYYIEQNRDRNAQVGLKNIENKTIEGKVFRKFDPSIEGISLLNKIKSELSAGRFLGIFLQPVKFHGYVIAGIEGENLLLLTKGLFEESKGGGHTTEQLCIPLSEVNALQNHDCIYYEEAACK